MENKKNYWKGIEQLTNNPEFVKNAEKEFSEHLPIKDAYGDNTSQVNKSDRRDFLKLMGFSVAAVSLAACEAPVRKAIPYLNKPEDIEAGIPNYYASTYIEGGRVCPILVKTREGRPIFVEGNNFASLTKGGIDAQVTASVLSLYDEDKIKFPTIAGVKAEWDKIDSEIISKLDAIAAEGKSVVILSNTITSPSTKKVIQAFRAKYPNAKLVSYDQDSASAIIAANNACFKQAILPSYDFSKAETVVSFGADFLGTWISPIEFTSQFMPSRKVGKDKKTMSSLFVFESVMSLTGANADYRTPIKPSQEGLAVAALYNAVAEILGASTINAPAIKLKNIAKAAEKLVASKGKSLVVSGSNDVNVQALVNGINVLLENYESTIELDRPSYVKQGKDNEMATFVEELGAGKIGGVIFYNSNPVYDHPLGAKIAASLKSLSLTVATADRLNETSSLCTYNCPDSHYLESWNDAEPKKGYFYLAQPTIGTVFQTRQVQSSLLTWSGNSPDYYAVIKKYWTETLIKLQVNETVGEKFWQRSLHDGVFEPKLKSYVSQHDSSVVQTDEIEAKEKTSSKATKTEQVTKVSYTFDVSSFASQVAQTYKADSTELEFVAYFNPIIGTGVQANNPILQETPDPISRVCWGNFVSVATDKAKELGVEVFENKVSTAKLSVNGKEVELPIVVQPGQAKGTVAVALGYGRTKDLAGKVATEAGGANAYALLEADETVKFTITKGVSITATGNKQFLAQTQTHHTIMGRDTIIQESTFASYLKDPKVATYQPKISTHAGKEKPTNISLWDINSDGYDKEKKRDEKADPKSLPWNERLGINADYHQYNQHHWGMAIDLNSCTGCGACVVACHLENNVPVVGKQEVINRREMHWLRIDRYYSSSKEATSYAELEEATENPEVVFQPMMCQHCNNAPCETVCPVAATTHSTEGLNQMTYNRCIGTKYCANNCPYKVRRFNWFKYHDNTEFNYHFNNDLGKMVINPDVTVRSRGVMEKCSLCVQRIQAGKLKAKKEARPVKDGEVKIACATACTAQAITFGDFNDSNSQIRNLMETELESRAYNVLDELNVRPNVWYLAKVRNNEGENTNS
jgi:molybdopterin-containing oxidoreductase family iron-sulfur binding subunit